MIARVEPITTTRRLQRPVRLRAARGSPSTSARSCGSRSGARRSTAWWSGSRRRPELAPERLVAPTAVREDDVPADLVALALWMAEEYCSTPARALALVMPPRGKPRTELWALPTGRRRTGSGSPTTSARCWTALPAPATGEVRRAAAARGARPGDARAAPAPPRAAHRRRARSREVALTARPGGRGGGGRGRRDAPAARRHRLRQDRGLPAGRGRGAGARRGRDRARARDRAHAADRRALPGALRRHRGAAALRAGGGRALRRVAPPAHRRGADRRRPALGGVRPGRRTSA